MIAGSPAPTAFNRVGEKFRATGGQLPRVTRIVPSRELETITSRSATLPIAAAYTVSLWPTIGGTTNWTNAV